LNVVSKETQKKIWLLSIITTWYNRRSRSRRR